jgi:SAM-dependent methyltransferase
MSLERVAETERERSRVRWRDAPPDAGLTWAKMLTGDAFFDAIARYHEFTGRERVVEVGPGYGRLPATMLERKIAFADYTGVEFSERNVEYLREHFDDPRFEFVHADVEELRVDKRFDVMISSLVLKHIGPSFEKGLTAVSRHMNPGGWLFFDLLESKFLFRLLRRERYFQEAEVPTFVRRYRRDEVIEILDHAGLDHVAFDSVQHDQSHKRLLVVARKPA